MSTGRLEAFSDGVFAIAITLLVLEIHVPKAEAGATLGRALLEQWPSYASYTVSFLIIGIIWVNHHAVFDHLTRVDRPILYLNLLLLLWVALIPWPTDLLATYMRQGGEDERVAALVYALTMTLMGASFGALWQYALRHERLLGEDLSPEELRARNRRFVLGTPLYALSICVALVSAPACLAINALVALFYVVPSGGAMPTRAERAAR